MKKSILSLVFISLFGLMSYAQGNLQFSKVKIVTNVQETVPLGKVWKATSIYGYEAMVCPGVSFTMGVWGSASTYPNYTEQSLIVNMKSVVNYSKIVRTCNNACNSGNCIDAWNANYSAEMQRKTTEIGRPDLLPNPNIFPMWLPENTTVQTGGPNTFVSVIEFNIIP